MQGRQLSIRSLFLITTSVALVVFVLQLASTQFPVLLPIVSLAAALLGLMGFLIAILGVLMAIAIALSPREEGSVLNLMRCFQMLLVGILAATPMLLFALVLMLQ